MTKAERLTPERTAVVLLAAGRSARFGAADKLGAPFLGRPLGLHVVTALAQVSFAARIAVCGAGAPDYAAHGYRIVSNAQASAGLSRSVQLGVQAARGCDAILLVLADMPRVSALHILRLFDAAEGADTVVASSDGSEPRPPALFGAAHFDTLETLTGDQGARALILGGRHVVTTADDLVDVDTTADLTDLQRRFGHI